MIRIRAGQDGDAEGCEYKNERENEAVAREEKERDGGREREHNIPTDQRGWTVTSG